MISLDDPLPLLSPFLSRGVVSLDVSRLGESETDTSETLCEGDFNLFDHHGSSSFGGALQHRPDSNAATHAISFPNTVVAHHESSAVAFDQTLQSPLFSPAQSASPQMSDGYWSSHDVVGSMNVSPLLLDNLAVVEPLELQVQWPRKVARSAQSPVSSTETFYSELRAQAQAHAQAKAQGGDPSDSRPRAAFSPIMSQRTYENLMQECQMETLPTALAEPVFDRDGVEIVPKEEEDMGENEHMEGAAPLGTLDRTTRSTRSSRHRPSVASTPRCASSSTTSTRHSSLSTSSTRGPAVLPLDAPIQPRKYSTESRTSRKPIPKGLLRRNELALEIGQVTRDELEDEANRRRRNNTLNARESRKRKALAIEQQAKENVELKEENEALKQRVDVLEAENEELRHELRETRGRGGVETESGRATKRSRA